VHNRRGVLLQTRCDALSLHPARSVRGTQAAALLTACVAMVGGAGCAPQTPFSEQNARAHINQLAGVIGSRPAGSDANRRARDYLIEQLGFYGYAVRVQEADAQRAELGLTAHVMNIIAIIPGATPDALGLVAHYDSRATAPGAGDDALGVSVALECGRLLAARRDRRHSIMVLLTDAEEEGLMGAAALVRDPEVRSRLRAYINLDAAGTDAPVSLFQTGPRNGWIVELWARGVRSPRGGSYQAEVYARLPSDTDFTVIQRTGAPGLNFAAVGDGYTYHTPRDTPDRVTSRAILTMGAAAISAAEALDRAELTQRSGTQAVYFDVAGARAVVLSPFASRALSVLAIVLGTLAIARTGRVVRAVAGAAGIVRSFAWGLIGVVAVGASLAGMLALLREAREVLHPWYAHPTRLWVLLIVTAIVVVEILLRAGERLPAAARGVRHASAVWLVTLPCWIVACVAVEAFAPAAAYLCSAPLLVLAIIASVVPGASGVGARLGALVVLAASALLWVPETRDVLQFAVPLFGRLAVVTPLFVYPAVLLAAGGMLAPSVLALDVAAPPHLAASAPTVARRRARILLTPALLVVVSIAFAACYLAEAYTFERPLQRAAQYVADYGSGRAVWEVAGVEPGLDVDLGRAAPAGWHPAVGPPLQGLQTAVLRYPFVLRAPGQIVPAPLQATLRTVQTDEGSVRVELEAHTARPGLLVLFAAPAGITPRQSSLPGRVHDGTWVAAYAAAPSGAVELAATFDAMASARLGEIRVAAIDRGLPGGEGWLRQPAWLASARTVWHARSLFVVTPALTPAVSEPALR
jgi:hypothetical protein